MLRAGPSAILMERVDDRTGAEGWRSPAGGPRMTNLSPSVSSTVFDGGLTAQFAPMLISAMYRVTNSGHRLPVFADFERTHNYHTVTRLKLTQALVQLRAKTDMLHFLVTSRVVALGLQTANIVLGNLISHPDRASFE